jgi:hypothetical protein
MYKTVRQSPGIVLVASLCSLGCEVVVNAQGVVYEWLNAQTTKQSIVIRAREVPDKYQVRPIPNAKVHLAVPQGKGGAPLLLSESTNASGSFEVGCLTGYPARSVLLRIEKPGFNDADFVFDPQLFGYHDDWLVILLNPADAPNPSAQDGRGGGTAGEVDGTK